MNEKLITQIHQKAKLCAERLRVCEMEMIEVLQEVDEHKIYRFYKAKSLFQYATVFLKLSESRACDFICVARKIRQVEALKVALQEKKLSVSKARRLAPVITSENAQDWISYASKFSQRDIERRIAKINPDSVNVHEGSHWVSETRLAFKASVDETTDVLIRRVQDLESQRLKRPVSLGEALGAMAGIYLKQNDPVEKAARALAKKPIRLARARRISVNAGKRTPIPAQTQHQVNLRDQGRCQAKGLDGKPCGNERWIEMHHLTPVSHGGAHSTDNLVTLCSSHHKMTHEHKEDEPIFLQ